MPKPITPSDLANTKVLSGYSHVSYAASVQTPSAKPYQAAIRDRGQVGFAWHGPRRKTALEAAQDYCDYVNGNGVIAGTSLKSAGHNGKRDSLPMSEEVAEALGILRDARAARAGKQGYVYLIVEDVPGGALHYGKIGFSTNPAARVAELQTGNPRKLRLLYAKPGTEADESALHAKYARYNVLQEWFWITKDLILEWDVAHQVPSDKEGKVAA